MLRMLSPLPNLVFALSASRSQTRLLSLNCVATVSATMDLSQLSSVMAFSAS